MLTGQEFLADVLAVQGFDDDELPVQLFYADGLAFQGVDVIELAG